jgi:hypothetical protein
MDGTIFDEEMPRGEEFSHDIRDVHEENKDRAGGLLFLLNMFEQHWHRTPPLFVVIVHRDLIHSHIHFHLFFSVYYYRKINCATNLHHLTSLLSLDICDEY